MTAVERQFGVHCFQLLIFQLNGFIFVPETSPIIAHSLISLSALKHSNDKLLTVDVPQQKTLYFCSSLGKGPTDSSYLY